MADKKISALTGATTPLAGTEVLPIVQSGSTVKVSVDNLTVGKRVNADSFVAGSTQAGTGFFTARNSSTGSDNVALSVEATNGTSFAKLIYNQTNDTLKLLNLSSYSGTTLELGANSATGVTFDVNNNIKFNVGNLIQGTAAKGVNFTANTPAAGMTSQLLNWYEEGNWTPAQGAGLTVVGAFSSTGHYTRIGRLVYVQGVVSGATSVAVNSANIITNNLPYSANTAASGSMFDAALTTNGGVAASTTIVYATTTIAATASITFSVVYIV